MAMDDDITIARNAKLEKIVDLARAKLGVNTDDLEPYGHYKAKVSKKLVDSLKDKPDGKLILVTAITPTPRQRPRRWPPPEPRASSARSPRR